MKNTKKLFAALAAVVMLISMFSCMVVPTVSAEVSTTLGGPVSIDAKVSSGSGIAVGGKELPENILVVCSSWTGKTGSVSIKLGGLVYRANMGVNAFAEIADAVAAADAGNTVYVAAGAYSTAITVSVANLKIYGPYAGVSPNAPFDGEAKNLSEPNPARPAAASAGAATDTEAVYSGRINIPKESPHLTVDGLYFTGGSCDVYNQSGALRYGTYFRNNILNITTAIFFNMDRGLNANFVFEDNRVLNGKTLTSMGGVMDIRYSRNYFNLTNVTARPSSFASGATGTSCIVEDNYYELCNGAIAYDRTSPYQIVLYSFIVRNNYVAKMGTGFSFVTNRYYANNSLPGISMQITGNTILGVNPDKAVMEFPYVASQGNAGTYRYIVNFNKNFVDLPADGMLVNSGMNGVLNCAYNYYTTPISADRVVKHPNAELILYPYYADEEMTTLVGDARITAVNLTYPSEINQKELTVTINMGDTTYPTVNMGAALSVSEGCTWKLYEDETLSKEIVDKTLYFDGIVTERYAAVYTPDGVLSNVYTIIIERDYCSEAKIVDILLSNSTVPSPEILGTAYIYDVPTDVAFLDYDIKVSSGATYTLYSDSACTKALEDIGSYIPYDGYTVYVWVKSEDKTMDAKYSITFNRERSDLYDPCVIDVIAPESGDTVVRPDRLNAGKLWMSYYASTLLGEAAFEFETTPGATWKLYKDAEKTTLLSASDNVKSIPLVAGTQTFYVEVADATGTNLITFVVENQTLSSEATITGIVGYAPTIVDNKIMVSGFGTTFNATFATGNPYAVCEVYADPAKTLKLEYTSSPVTEPDSIRVIDQRSFAMGIQHANTVYYVDCIAEDGTVNSYTMIIDKTVAANPMVDVASDTWFAPYVEEVLSKGYMAGDGDTNTFRPDDKTTREEMAVVAARLLGYDPANYASVKLNMKDAGSIVNWALGSVKVCYHNGIMKGNAEGTGVFFKPKANITRQEVMVMFARMFKLNGTYDLSVFSDANQIADWAKAEVQAVVASGLIVGSEGKLNPNAFITRAELAAIIARAK